jgi:hypothetical protein
MTVFSQAPSRELAMAELDRARAHWEERLMQQPNAR